MTCLPQEWTQRHARGDVGLRCGGATEFSMATLGCARPSCLFGSLVPGVPDDAIRSSRRELRSSASSRVHRGAEVN